MKRILVVFALSVIAGACGGGVGGGGAKVDVKIGGKDVSVATKSSGSYTSVKTFTDIGGAMTKASAFHAFLASYDMDTTTGASMRKPVASADQARVEFSLIGEEGTDDKAPVKVGVYKVDPAGKFMNVDSLSVHSFADGKATDTRFDVKFSASKATGQIEVTSVTADSVSGRIDVTDGDKSVKGAFTAKLPVKK